MKRVDLEEIGAAVRLGGKIGLAVLAPPSVLLTFLPLFGSYPFADADTVARWVRMGFEIFLIGGWAAGAISLVRQFVAASMGDLLGVVTSGATGILVMNLMAVIFTFISSDAPDLGYVLLIGVFISFGIAVALTRRANR